jgi:predicted NUDIX family phosphoesterase
VCVIEIISDSSIEVVKEKKSTIAWRWIKKLNLEKAIAESLKKETPSKELYKK